MATSDKRELLLKVKVDDDASRPLKRIGDQGKDTASDLEKTNAGLKALDEKSAAAKKTIEGLRTEIAKTGDLELVKDLSKQEARLKQFARQRRLILGDGPDGDGLGPTEDDGQKSGRKFLGGFRKAVASGAGQVGEALSEGLSAAPLQVKAAVAGVVVAGIVAGASTGAAIISGAVLTGLGGGAVAAGVATALQDPAVKMAGAGLGATLRDSLSGAGDAFKEPTLAAIADVRRQVPGIGTDLKSALAPAAGYVLPLERGLTGLVKNVIPGIAAGIKAAGPTIAVIERELPRVGAAVSDMIESIAENADEAAAGFETLLRIVEGTVRTGGAIIGWLTDAYDWVLKIQLAAGATADKFLGWVPGVGGTIKDFNQATAEMIGTASGAGDASADAGQKMADGWLKAARAAEEASKQVETLAETADGFAKLNMDAGRAQIALEGAIDSATAAAKENGKTLDTNTEKGRANKTALYDLAEAAMTARDKTMEQTGSQELASDALERGRSKFLAVAESMGLSAAKAKALADQLFGIPLRRDVVVTANTAPALDAAKGVVARINNMKARISVSTYNAGTYGGSAHTGQGNSTGYSGGGEVRGNGPKGVDSVPAMLAPGEVVWNADDVDAAGGPAAVDRMRRRMRAGVAASATPDGGMAGGGGGGAPTLVINAAGASGLDRVFLAWLITAIRDAGGNPTALGM